MEHIILNILKYTIYLPCVEKKMDQDTCQICLQILHLTFSILPEKSFHLKIKASKQINNLITKLWAKFEKIYRLRIRNYKNGRQLPPIPEVERYMVN